MADIRINSLPTTATSTSFDDYVAVDGSGNGTRKLSAFSPTFGGNLTVSGSTNLTSSSLNSYIYDGTGWVWTSTGTSGGTVKGGIYAAGGLLFLTANSSLATNRFSLNSSGDATVAGNLTVSGNVYGTSNLVLYGTTGATGNVYLRAQGAGYVRVDTGSGFRVESGSLDVTAGSLTVSGTGTSTFSGPIRINATSSAPTAGSFSTSAGNGLEIWPKSGSSYDLLVYTAAGSSLLSVPSGTNNLTLAGNLTVSGGSGSVSSVTINSSYAGNYSSINLTNSGSGGTAQAYSINVAGSLTGASSDRRFYIYDNTASAIRLAIAPTTGNLLLKGDGIDSGNGKLQLATHTTSPGGIGFGTDTSLFRAASGNLGLYGTGTSSKITFSHSTTTAGKGFEVECDTAKDGYVWNRENRNIFLGTNNTVALTLDSSQNATFANTIFQTQPAAGSTPNLSLAESGIRSWGFYATGGKISIRPSSPGIWSFNGNTDVELVRTTASTSTTTGALVVSGGVGVAGAVNVGGAIAIGNTVNTVSPTSPNRTITMVIGGTTYYIHAKTTND